jgi:hypothetical protein
MRHFILNSSFFHQLSFSQKLESEKIIMPHSASGGRNNRLNSRQDIIPSLPPLWQLSSKVRALKCESVKHKKESRQSEGRRRESA